MWPGRDPEEPRAISDFAVGPASSDDRNLLGLYSGRTRFTIGPCGRLDIVPVMMDVSMACRLSFDSAVATCFIHPPGFRRSMYLTVEIVELAGADDSHSQ